MILGFRPRAAVGVVRYVWRHPANRGRRLRKVFETIAFQVRGRVRGIPSVAAVGTHSKMWSHLHVGVSARAIYANPPDWPEMLVWRNSLRSGDLFIDVGAHAGLYTIWAIDHGATVVAVEPNPVAAAQLQANLALNGYSADVVVGALSDRSGVATLAGPDLARQHLVPGTHDMTSGPDALIVEVRTLDELLGDRVAAGVKVDVEGAERLVMAGARRALLERRLRIIQLEWNPCSMDLLGEDRWAVARLLQSYGYRLFRPDHDGRLVYPADGSYGSDVYAVAE